MIRNIMKLMVLITVSFSSLEVASYTINELVKQVKEREETITDAIIKKQVENTFKEVEKQIEEVVKEEQIEIKTEKVEMKPPVEKKEPPKKEVAQEDVSQEDKAEEKPQTPQVVQEDSVVEETELEIEMTKEHLVVLGTYLVENYFLDGNQYYQAETDPIRYERKKLTHEMESYIISSLGSLFNIITDMKQINEEVITTIVNEAESLSQEFAEQFKDASEIGEEFGLIYEEVNQYFLKYIETLTQMKNSLLSIHTAPNPSLVISIIMKDLNQVIIPGIKNVINTGFDLKNKTNNIYLEGIEGVNLLTREEVIQIIKDPTAILKKEEAKPTNDLETSELPKNNESITIENKEEEIEGEIEEEKVPEQEEEILPEHTTEQDVDGLKVNKQEEEELDPKV